MKRSTILQRLALLTAIPLAALLIFAAALISNSYGLYRNAGQTQELMRVSVAAGDVGAQALALGLVDEVAND